MCSKSGIYIWRQLSLLTAKCIVSFGTGINLAFPAVLSPAILAPDADIKATPDQVSWIVTSLGISSWVGYIILPLIFEVYGRKITNIVISLITLLGGLTFYVASDVFSLAFARLIQGLAFGGSIIGIMSICECVSPKRRGYFMVVHKVTLGLGSLACHFLAFFLNWRQIAICGALPNCIAIMLLIICAESPSYFAKRGQFDKCAKSFEWYRGKSLKAKNELNELITAQKEILETRENETGTVKKLKEMVVTKEFRKSFIMVALLCLCVDTCGRYFLLSYISQILIEITKSVVFAKYVALAFDCIWIFALCVSYVLIKRFKRRTLLFKSGFFSVFLMFMVSVSIIIRNKLLLLEDMKWLTLAVILLHTFIINVGLVPVAFALSGEVYALEHRGLGSCLSGVINSIFLTTVLKLTPMVIDKTGVAGTYFLYGFCLCISLLLLHSILPETKDKTLQQVENEIKGTLKTNSMTDSVKYCKVSNC